MKRYTTLGLCILFCAARVFAAIILSGRVSDKTTSESLPGAIVELSRDGDVMRTAANGNGEYSFTVPSAGKYTVVAHLIGYNFVKKEIDIKSGQNITLDFALQSDATDLEEVVVSATHNATKRSEAPVVVNVLNHNLFSTINSTNLSQTLSYQPGVRVENNCQNCGFPQVRINGLEGPYSQILINSRPVVSSLSGVYALEQMPVNMVERIEVVRGGGSALFGANAVAGTINVITRDPINPSFEAGTVISCMDGKTWDDTFTANAALSGNDGKYGIALYESFRHRNPYDRDDDGFSEVGKLHLNSFGINGFYRPSEMSRLGLEYHTTTEFRRGGNYFDLQPHEADICEQTDHDIHSGGLNYTHGWDAYKYRLNIYGSAQHISRNSYYGAQQNPDAYGKSKDMTWVTGATFSAEINKAIFAPSSLMLGLEYQNNSLRDRMLGYGRELSQDVNIFGVFAQNEWKIKRFTILAGLRIDKHNLIDNAIISPRLNLLYRPAKEFQGRLTYSSGFRAPQAYDEDLHVTAVGGEGVVITLADGLKPEKSHSFSGSADWDFNIGEIDMDILLEGFYTRLNDVFVLETLDYDTEAGMAYKERRNGSGAEVYGANIDLKASFTPLLTLQGGFTAQRSRYLKPETWSDNPAVAPTRNMPRTPDFYGYFTLSGKLWRNFEWAFSGVYTGRMDVPHFAPDPTEIPDNYPIRYISADEMVRTPSFMEVNMKLSYDIRLGDGVKAQISAGIQNIGNAFQKDLDKGTFRDSGFFYGPAAPRTYFIGLKFMSI